MTTGFDLLGDIRATGGDSGGKSPISGSRGSCGVGGGSCEVGGGTVGALISGKRGGGGTGKRIGFGIDSGGTSGFSGAVASCSTVSRCRPVRRRYAIAIMTRIAASIASAEPSAAAMAMTFDGGILAEYAVCVACGACAVGSTMTVDSATVMLANVGKVLTELVLETPNVAGKLVRRGLVIVVAADAIVLVVPISPVDRATSENILVWDEAVADDGLTFVEELRTLLDSSDHVVA